MAEVAALKQRRASKGDLKTTQERGGREKTTTGGRREKTDRNLSMAYFEGAVVLETFGRPHPPGTRFEILFAIFG